MGAHYGKILVCQVMSPVVSRGNTGDIFVMGVNVRMEDLNGSLRTAYSDHSNRADIRLNS
jgi:hypothetical protein